MFNKRLLLLEFYELKKSKCLWISNIQHDRKEISNIYQAFRSHYVKGIINKFNKEVRVSKEVTVFGSSTLHLVKFFPSAYLSFYIPDTLDMDSIWQISQHGLICKHCNMGEESGRMVREIYRKWLGPSNTGTPKNADYLGV